jgi:hypothetical protein
MPTLSITVPNDTQFTTTIESPVADVLKWTHEDRTTSAARDLVARGDVCPQIAAAAVTLARNNGVTSVDAVAQADATALIQRLVPQLLASPLTEGERFVAALEAVDLVQWDALARAADWSQQFITAFYRVRQAREEAARAVKRKREAVVQAETEANVEARLAASIERIEAEAKAPEAFVAFAIEARRTNESDEEEAPLPPIEISYKRFTRFNREDTAERIEEGAFVSKVPLLFDDFRRYCVMSYPEMATLPNAHHRQAEIFKLWRSRQDALTVWCEARGRIATYAEFQTLHKERCAKRKLRLHDAWSDYTKAWDRLVGMTLSVRRRTNTPGEAEPRRTATSSDTDERAPKKKKTASAAADASDAAESSKKPNHNTTSTTTTTTTHKKKEEKKTKKAASASASTGEEEEEKSSDSCGGGEGATKKKTSHKKKRDENSEEDEDDVAERKEAKKEPKKKAAVEDEMINDDDEDDDEDDYECEMPRRIGQKKAVA